MKDLSAYFPPQSRPRLLVVKPAGALLLVFLTAALLYTAATFAVNQNDFEMTMEAIVELPEQAIVTALITAANSGSPEAALALGNRFFQGDGVEQNMRTAVKWWKVGSALNSPRAAYNLGVAYLNGYGTAKDLSKAQQAFVKAATDNLPNAHLALGILSLHKAETKEEFTTAGEHFRKAAKLGSAVAHHNLALMYERGLGYDRDEEQAEYWRSSAAKLESTASLSAEENTSAHPSSAPANIIRTHKWINARPQENYTLQLASGDILDATEKLISTITVLERAIFRKVLAGRERFVAIAGDFVSYSEALSAIENLPASFLENKPFILSFRVIQRQIDAHTKFNN